MKRFLCIVLALTFIFITACTASTSVNDSLDTSVDSSGSDIVFSYPAYDDSSEETTGAEGSSSEDSTASTESEEITSSEEGGNDSSAEQNTSSAAPVVPDVSVPPIDSPDISVDNSPYGEVWINDLKDQQDTDYHGYDPEVLDDYFDDALFVGDSVANGLKLYTTMYEKVFQGMVFHTGACYGYHNCLSKVTSSSMHPLYQGQKRNIWEMVALTNPNKVFIGFGLNDFGCTTTKSVKNCLDKIIANIRAVKPDVEIIILSSGYFTKAGESYKPNLNDYRTCFRQRDYNQFVLEYCNALGLDYIDVSNCFADEYGYLPKESSLDNYCHPQIKLYTAWRDILYGYAADKMQGTYQNPARMR